MLNGIRTGDPCGFNEGRSSKFRESSRVRQTPEEGRRIYWPKRRENNNNNKDEDNSLKTLNDKNTTVVCSIPVQCTCTHNWRGLDYPDYRLYSLQTPPAKSFPEQFSRTKQYLMVRIIILIWEPYMAHIDLFKNDS